MDQAGMIIAEVALLLSLCLLAARQAYEQRHDFEAELAATRAGEYPPETAYRSYRRAVSQRLAQAAVWYLTILLFAVFITIFATIPDFLPIIGVPSPLVPIFFALLGLIIIAPPFLLSALTASTDAAALVQLNGVATSAGTLLIFRLKRNGLLLLPPALTVVEGVTLYLLRTPPFRLLAVNLYSFIGEYAIIVLAISPISRWLYATELIEQTQWAEVGARALTWAQRTSVPLRRVYLRRVERLGVAMNSLGWPFSHTLYLSDTFLTHSEWRQCDALICQLLMSRRAPTLRRFRRLRTLAQVALTALILALIGFSLYITTFNNFTIYDFFTFEGLLLGLSVICFSITFVTLAKQRHQQNNPHYDAVTPGDRAIIALCGDPLALVATLVTMLSLQGIDLDRSFLSGRWTQKDHILAIERTLRQPGPYAPWAFQPIPTMEPLPVEPTLAEFTLSVPLTAADADARPTLVPTTTYPVIDSPWQGT